MKVVECPARDSVGVLERRPDRMDFVKKYDMYGGELQRGVVLFLLWSARRRKGVEFILQVVNLATWY